LLCQRRCQYFSEQLGLLNFHLFHAITIAIFFFRGDVAEKLQKKIDTVLFIGNFAAVGA